MDSEQERLKLPDDIQQAAADAFNADLPEGEALWQIVPWELSDQVLLAIGRAVIAERERSARGIACRIEEQPFHPGRFILTLDGASLDSISYPSTEAAQQALKDALAAAYRTGEL